MLPINAKPSEQDLLLSEVKQAELRKILEKGLPLKAKPYLEVAKQINTDEQTVLNQIEQWQFDSLIKRFGLVVKHRQLGYVANAMVVWDIQNDQVDAIANELAKRNEISLCYRRPRRLPDWPYNLFCMIHGKSREQVEQQIRDITDELSLSHINKHILFSHKAYKQQGARYSKRKSS